MVNKAKQKDVHIVNTISNLVRSMFKKKVTENVNKLYTLVAVLWRNEHIRKQNISKTIRFNKRSENLSSCPL